MHVVAVDPNETQELVYQEKELIIREARGWKIVFLKVKFQIRNTHLLWLFCGRSWSKQLLSQNLTKNFCACGEIKTLKTHFSPLLGQFTGVLEHLKILNHAFI